MLTFLACLFCFVLGLAAGALGLIVLSHVVQRIALARVADICQAMGAAVAAAGAEGRAIVIEAADPDELVDEVDEMDGVGPGSKLVH